MNAAIIQARMGASRLPGKVLMEIKDDESVLHYVIKQLRYCKTIDKIIVATSNLSDDDVIRDVCNDLSVECFRGDEKNVLDRYYKCSKKFSISPIIRIPADKPLIDPRIVDYMLNIFNSGSYDYVTNFLPLTFPSGTEVEIFSFDTIKKAWQNAVLPSYKEHVTKYIYTHKENFRIFNVKNENDLSKFRWAVDRIEDLRLVREIVKRIKKRPIVTGDIIKILENEPDLIKINGSMNYEEGSLKSLEEDKNFLKQNEKKSK